MWEGLKEREKRRGEEGASSILSSASLQLSPPVLHLSESQWVQSLDPPNHLHSSSHHPPHPTLPLIYLLCFSSPFFLPSPSLLLMSSVWIICEYSTNAWVFRNKQEGTESRQRERERDGEGGWSEVLRKWKQKYLPLLKFINYSGL